VRDQDRVVVSHERAVVTNEVEKIRHLLEIRRHVGVIAPEVNVIEYDKNDVLDLIAKRIQLARGLAFGRAEWATCHSGSSKGS